MFLPLASKSNAYRIIILLVVTSEWNSRRFMIFSQKHVTYFILCKNNLENQLISRNLLPPWTSFGHFWSDLQLLFVDVFSHVWFSSQFIGTELS